jgi:hypothetical protein
MKPFDHADYYPHPTPRQWRRLRAIAYLSFLGSYLVFSWWAGVI